MVLKARPATVPATESGDGILSVRTGNGHEQALLVVDQVQHHAARPDPARRFGNRRGHLRRATQVRAPQQVVEHVRHRRVARPGRRRGRVRVWDLTRHVGRGEPLMPARHRETRTPRSAIATP